MENLFDIHNKVIVITGAAGVLAGSTSRYLLSQGASVIMLDICEDKLETAVKNAEKLPGKAYAYKCNVMDKKRLYEIYNDVMEKIGRVDVLINGAGGNMPGATIGPEESFTDLDINDYEKVLDLNLKGSVLPSLCFSKAFIRQKKGCIINFSSMASPQAITRVLAYSNAKAAIDNFTRWMAAEMAIKYGDGIRVNAIAPGFFIGNQNRKLLINEDGTYTERGQKVIDNTPFRRFGKSEEVHGCIHFLMSEAASFITGTVIPVDGGFSSFSGV
jgi:NAD(P)-dependent dehydrogenase (short-subunit alcohol dehydrogenase family)